MVTSSFVVPLEMKIRIVFSNGFAMCLQTGPDDLTPETMGVNYRALNDLFDIQQQRKNMIAYEVCVQMLEIYNETVRDLLITDGSNKKYPFI